MPGKWDGSVPQRESGITSALLDTFDNTDYHIYLYHNSGPINRTVASSAEDTNIHIGFYGCSASNVFENIKERADAVHNLTTGRSISYQGHTEVLSIDTGTFSSSSIDIKVNLENSTDDEIVVARITYPNTICVLLKPESVSYNLMQYILSEAAEFLCISEQEFKSYLRHESEMALLTAIPPTSLRSAFPWKWSA